MHIDMYVFGIIKKYLKSWAYHCWNLWVWQKCIRCPWALQAESVLVWAKWVHCNYPSPWSRWRQNCCCPCAAFWFRGSCWPWPRQHPSLTGVPWWQTSRSSKWRKKCWSENLFPLRSSEISNIITQNFLILFIFWAIPIHSNWGWFGTIRSHIRAKKSKSDKIIQRKPEGAKCEFLICLCS